MQLVEQLVRCWRFDDAATKEGAMTMSLAIAEIFSRYPEEVIREVCHPFEGLPAKCKFFPSLQEIRAACDASLAPLERIAARDVQALETHRLLAPPGPEDEAFKAAVVQRYWTGSLRENMAQGGEKAPKPQETAAETLARLSGLPIEDVLAKLDEVPSKPPPPTA